MKPYKEYKIGDVVRAKNTTVSVVCADRYRRAVPHKYRLNLLAYYVGYTYLQNGKITHSSGYCEDYDQGYLDIENTTLVARIIDHSRGKIEYALFKDIEKVDGLDPDKEYDHNGVKTWRKKCKPEQWERYSKELSDHAKQQNRDANGRFIK